MSYRDWRIRAGVTSDHHEDQRTMRSTWPSTSRRVVAAYTGTTAASSPSGEQPDTRAGDPTWRHTAGGSPSPAGPPGNGEGGRLGCVDRRRAPRLAAQDERIADVVAVTLRH